ncbi:MAG: hypothetical protein V1855_02430 [bacterium]
MGKNKILFVIYDGIENSVFQSQVLKPLLISLDQNQQLEITLISFETHRVSQKILAKVIPAHPRFHFVMFQRIAFCSSVTLWIALYHLRRFLKNHYFDTVICRGPLAGYLALQGFKMLPSEHQPHEVIIQARGLCAQEYRYAHLKTPSLWYKKLIHIWIYRALEHIEQKIFEEKKDLDFDLTIEAVSLALKEYLVQHFNADPAMIIIAHKDIPAHIDKNIVAQWRKEIREQLNIAQDAIVYCYSGSFKPWQCISETFSYFADQYKDSPKSFMLVLTQDKEQCIQILENLNIPKKQYAVVCVAQDDLYKYLAAADFGMLFREKDCINWVSRPTKMLEYQAVGLDIIHNNTIACLSSEFTKRNSCSNEIR